MHLTPRTAARHSPTPAARTRRTPRIRRDDRGLTLVELLVSIVILGVISVPLGDALITFFQHSTETTNRLSESHDAQIAAAYFAQDVESLGRRDWTTASFPLAQSVELNVGPTQGLFPCGAAGTPNAILRLLWDDPSATDKPKVVRVAYVMETVGPEQQLHRIKCVDNGTPVSDVVLAHNLNSYMGPTCSTSCTAAAVPQTVSLTLRLQAKNSNDQFLDIVLTGQRRQT